MSNALVSAAADEAQEAPPTMKKTNERKSAAPKKNDSSKPSKGTVAPTHKKKVELTEDDLRDISGGGPIPARCCEYMQQ